MEAKEKSKACRCVANAGERRRGRERDPVASPPPAAEIPWAGPEDVVVADPGRRGGRRV